MRLAALALAVALVAGCGGADDEQLIVFAASSLSEVFEQLEPDARYNFAGSDELATQLREGADADVYASASPGHAVDLHREGIVERPRLLAANQVVLVVPRSNRAGIETLTDVARPGVRLVIAAPGVPAGDYAREALERDPRGDAILANVVSEEQDVKAVVAKVALGEADAGFAYRTDVGPAAGDVVEVGDALARAEYAIALVREGDRDDAERFVERMLAPEGQQALLGAGFVTTSEAGRPLP
ncbi:MAG: molybdate ABC transporter substrate-binding protein [Actinomycetota bacterium]|nr:molybdate ABC transporter substrate-binding protein [Actinomycetota bacterium]